MTAKTADFGGYATKNGLLCSDGRTIMADAFKHFDKKTVPLVWQHQHNEPVNVLGHAILENRPDGVYAYGFFNSSPYAQHAKEMVEHEDINALSIYANNLTQQGAHVLHGDIREVSLVLAGANPGAIIDEVYIRHADGSKPTVVPGEAFISSADPLELEPVLQHSDSETETGEQVAEEIPPAVASTTPEVPPVVETPTETAAAPATDQSISHADTTKGDTVATDTEAGSKTVKQIFDEMTEEQKNVVYFMIGAALEDDDDDSVAQSAFNSNDQTIQHGYTEDNMTTRNVFETHGSAVRSANRPTLSHSDVQDIVKRAEKTGSFKEAFLTSDAVLAHAQTYGIENIDVLFPDAKALANSPEIIGRRTEWVASVINGTKHSPFSRIKSTAADLTADEARAKGYVKGALKKDEIIKLLRRITTPTTIYKKQKLDRDDVVDITDLDVVAWLKAEMRLMLEEELAGAILIGDGRASDDDDKIDEDHIRPIAYDSDMYAHQLVVASELSPEAVVESILRSRTYYKGTGTPTMYTTDAILTDLLLIKDRNRRRVYNSEQELAQALRVKEIVTVEIMDRTPDVVAIIVNLADYTIGADQGGNVSMFDDFDIDYNQLKYLIETRVSGALTKPKSALVIKRTLGTVVTPTAPSFNGTTNTITIPSVTGVVYNIEGAAVTGSVVIEEATDVEARPATGYSFPPNTGRDWSYVPTGA